MEDIIENKTIQKEDWSQRKLSPLEISNCQFNSCNFTETDKIVNIYTDINNLNEY